MLVCIVVTTISTSVTLLELLITLNPHELCIKRFHEEYIISTQRANDITTGLILLDLKQM